MLERADLQLDQKLFTHCSMAMLLARRNVLCNCNRRGVDASVDMHTAMPYADVVALD